MNDKYYTPSIKEFHVGFRYEVIKGNNIEWKSEVFDETYSFSYIKEYLIPNKRVRVKCLDREDIEELGWIKSENCTKFLSNINASSHFCKVYGVTNPIWYHLVMYNNTIEISISNLGDLTTLFKGTIKNYNQLESLMNQLNKKL